MAKIVLSERAKALKEDGIELVKITVYKDNDGSADEGTKKTFIMQPAGRKAMRKAMKASNNMEDAFAFSESIIYSCIVDGDKESLKEDWVMMGLIEKSEALIQKTHATVEKL